MNNKNDKSISRSRLTGKYLTRNDILKMSAIKAKNNILEEELAHYGILGMKWGVRRYQPYPKGHNQLKKGGRFTGNKPKKMSKKERLEKEVSSLSDEELRSRLNRMNMEEQYKNLSTKRNRTLLTVGGAVVGGTIAISAKETAKNYISKAMSKGVDATVNKVKRKVTGG